MNEESVRDFKNLYFKVVPQPETNSFWIDGEGEYRFPLSWNEEWVNPKVDRKELSESKLLFVDALSKCWGKKDNHLPTRLLLTQPSRYIRDEILAHLLSKSKKSVTTVGSSSVVNKVVSPEVVPPTSSVVHDSSSGRDTSTTPSPSIPTIQEVDDSNREITQT
ncbi:hypothetical protein PIB30_030901 [Stylosanthes scabra]|uniref:Uncharacterized protein n=1 Tax=Stylosanthes scabra TaxID=79078 RepID=A0ABU6YC26_9FABA|nr:hypothetical protein [Stylosanthes scabra]